MMGGAVLCLDQSLSSTGFALLPGEQGGAVLSGSWPLCAGVASRAEGFRELWHKMNAVHKGHTLTGIVHERPSFGAVNKGEAQLIGAIGLIAVIELFAVSRGIALASYPVQSWRGTFFTKEERKALRGGDWKHPAILRCRQLGFDPVSHDEAEAIAILDHHLHKSGIQPHWRKGASAMLEPVA